MVGIVSGCVDVVALGSVVVVVALGAVVGVGPPTSIAVRVLVSFSGYTQRMHACRGVGTYRRV